MCTPQGYDIAGTEVAVQLYRGDERECLRACLANPTCQAVVTSSARGTCRLLRDPFVGPSGANQLQADVDRSCIKALPLMPR